MIDDAQLVNTLLEQGIVDQATLKSGVEQSRQSKRSLYENLILNKVVDEDQLVSLVSGILNVPHVDPDPAEIPSDVRDLVPASMARRNRVLPLRLHEGELVLGMVDPIDVLAMDEVATHTGIDIRPVLIGPATIHELLEDLYGVAPPTSGELADDVMASFDDLDVEGMMDDVMEDEEWDTLFDDEEEEEQPSVEDSAVLSREMRDRPSTDVLAEEDVDAAVEEADREGEPAEIDEEELIEIEIIEELGKPVDVEHKNKGITSLSEWELDEAIAGPGDSEILSVESAEALFREEDTDMPAALDAVEDDTIRAEVESRSEAEELEDTHSSKTSIGVSVDHLEDGTLGGEAREAGEQESEAEENTGRTELGVATRADGGGDSLAPPESTDYGALGRAILKSSPSSSEATDDEIDAADEDETNVREEADGHAGTTVRESSAEEVEETDVREPPEDTEIRPSKLAEHSDPSEGDSPDSRPTDPEPDYEAPSTTDVREADADVPVMEAPGDSDDEDGEGEIGKTDIIDPAIVEEDKRLEMTGEDQEGEQEDPDVAGETRPRLNSPQMRLPEEIDVEGLALALANLLISKDILTLDEVFQLARSLTPDDE